MAASPTHPADTALAALDGTAFTCDGSRFSFSRDAGLPTDLVDFTRALGPDAARRDLAMAESATYRINYRLHGQRWEETGRTLADGTVAGLLRPLGPVHERPAFSLLDRERLLCALNDRRLRLAFQPIVEARSHALHHHECLMRMEAEDGTLLPAPQVIGSAEALGLVPLLDRRALEVAARTMISHPGLRLALNVSAQTVADKAAARDYLDALRMLGPAAHRLTIELTETIAVEDPTMAARFSTHARAMGCGFAVDDFGAGFTSFRNLMAIEADSIKIDGDFVDGLLSSPRAQAFVRMMVDLAQTFGVKTVAERVETREVADCLTDLGIDYLQGYYFGKPALDTPISKVA